MSILKRGGLAALTALLATPVFADEPEFPAPGDTSSLASWLDARTNIKPASVVTVTPGFVVALVGKQKPVSPEGPVRVTLREEVIAPAFIDSVGGRSALISAEIQCEERRLRMDGRDLYAGPNLSGRKAVDGPSTEWLRIPEDTVMDEVANAACNADYAWPLQAYVPAPAVAAEHGAPPPAVEPAPPALQALAEQAAPPPAEPSPPPEVKPVEEAKIEQPTELTKPAVRYAVQIGAYRNQQLAETAWKALSTQRPVVTEGHDFDVRPVKVKGKELLRGLVLNFKSPQDGAAFCSALVGSGYGCILRVLPD